MPGVAAFIDHVFRRFVFGADLDELGISLVLLAKMGTHAALSVVNHVHHGKPPKIAAGLACLTNQPEIIQLACHRWGKTEVAAHA